MTLRTDCGLSRAARDYIRQQTRGEIIDWINAAYTGKKKRVLARNRN
jgi:hypothetical protein